MPISLVMGNSSTKEARPQSRNGNRRSSDNTSSPSDNADSRPQLHGPRSSRHRQDSTFLALGSGSGTPGAEPRKETKQEREARKAKKEQSLRLKERERSLREEGVDGGYLVTLGTYTGPEDFSKTVVRQLMVRVPLVGIMVRVADKGRLSAGWPRSGEA